MAQISMVNGRLPDELVNNSWCVSLKGSQASQSGIQNSQNGTQTAVGEKIHFSSPSFDTIDFDPSRAQDLTDKLYLNGIVPSLPEVDEDGKTIVGNLWSGLIIGSTIGEDGRPITFPEDANKSAAQGAATHGFFFHTTDFLMEAAEKYSTLGENETFRFRDIQDAGFIRDTLDFLTNGNYTKDDVTTLQEQMEDVVLELAQQIKQGETPDLSRVETKLTIGGSDIGIDQLFELQSLGKELEGVLNETSAGQLYTFTSAQKGLAKSIAAYYGKNYGAVGEQFADGIERLYEKSLQNVQKLSNSMDSGYGGIAWSQKQKDAVQTGFEISDLFANLDTSSKDAFLQDFNAKLSDMRSMALEYGNKYHLSATDLGLAGTTADLIKYVQSMIS